MPVESAFLSTKAIANNERLMFALDVPTYAEAERLIDHLGDSIQFYKLGLELCMSGRYFDLMQKLVDQGKKVFADLKFFDVPQTVRSAVKQLQNHGASFVTVHGNDSILEAAVAEKTDQLKILAVTVLTSLDKGDLEDLGFAKTISTKEIVLSRAKRALAIGCDGVISSGIEVPSLRQFLGESFVVVSPGIRPVDNRMIDDQKRTVDVEQAFYNGADYIVVGRPIKQHPGFVSPRAAAEDIQHRISQLFRS